MKKISFFCALVLLPLMGFTQLLPNGSFENWTSNIIFQQPTGYSTTNFRSYHFLGSGNVSRTSDAHSGNYAARLETVGNGTHVEPAGIFAGQPGNGVIIGGIPYTQTPISMSFWAKGNIPSGDSAIVMFLFKKSFQPIGGGYAVLKGSYANYQQFVITPFWVTPMQTPDTLAVTITSSSYNNLSGMGSILYIDNISFTGVTAQIPNNDLEQWNDYVSEEPQNWMSSNSQTNQGGGLSVSKSIDHVDGSYSARIETQLNNWGSLMGFLILGSMDVNGNLQGTPVSQTPGKFSFYYKYFPSVGDSAQVIGMFSYYNSLQNSQVTLSQALLKLPAAANWTYCEVPFVYSDTITPDTLLIGFISSNLSDSSIVAGSYLLLDKVEVSMVAGIQNMSESDLGKFLSPNPTHDYINLVIPPEARKSDYSIEILDETGRLIYQKKGHPLNGNNSEHLDLKNYRPGLYFIRLINSLNQWSGKVILN
ncbi:MAG: T9SS type A sorting domain-containing protein [Bacteroidota bacterium]